MPQNITIEVSANSVKSGDRLDKGMQLVEVENVDSKQKWTVIELVNGRKLRLENTQQVKVVREVPTDEEVAAKKAADNALFIEHMLESAFRSACASFEAVKKTAARVASDSSYSLDSQWSPINAHMKALALRDIWTEVVHNTGRTWGDHSDRAGERVTFLDAIRETVKEQEQALIGNRWRGQSSDPISNAIDSVRREVASEWLRSMEIGALKYADTL